VGADEVIAISPHGRWGGRITSRALPDDPAIDALGPETRRVLADVWTARIASERRVADSFAVVRDALLDLDAPRPMVELASRAVDDEMRHSALCREVASRYAGSDVAPPPHAPSAIPKHAGASDELRRTLHVVGQCAINETIACAFLEASLAHATSPFARAALRELMSDEIDHARIGWAHLSSLRAPQRAEVTPWVPSMVRANLKMWRDAPRPYPVGDEYAAHGAPSIAMVEDAIVTAVRDLVMPGFAELGVDVAPVRAWLDDGAPT
jgi:hypothetical protein